MTNPLILKLEHYAKLSEEDRAAALRLWGERQQRFAARDEVIREGDNPLYMRLVVEGWACRHKHLEDGRRQIFGLFVPGDFCDMNVFILREMDHDIGALTPLVVAHISRAMYEEVMYNHPRLMQAMWWASLVSMAIQREWAVSLGQRNAYERIAHLMCEVYFRLRAAGLTRGMSCEFPLTQTAIADITGLSAVHVSRTFQALREDGLVEFRKRVLVIPNLEALMGACLFHPNYLHLDHEGRHLDAVEDAPLRNLPGLAPA